MRGINVKGRSGVFSEGRAEMVDVADVQLK